MEEIRKYRKNQNTLSVSGSGLIILGFWSVIKTIMLITYNRGAVDALFEGLVDDALLETVVVVMLVVVSIIDLLIRVYVGTSASAEARGRKKGYAYPVVSAAFVLLYITSLYAEIAGFFEGRQISGEVLLDDIIVMVVDFISLGLFISVIVSSICVKRFRRKSQ